MKITICAIIKNEQRYLEEWIKHNLSIGFTDIHLYEDYGSLPHKDITSKYSNVHLHSYSEVLLSNYVGGDKKQMDLFTYFTNTYKSEYDWCAFIDPDEFIRLEEGYSLERLCSEYKDYNGVMLQQKTYGANGHIKRPSGGLQENYTADTNVHEYHKVKFNMKTIVNFNKDKIEFKGVHRVRGAVFTNYVNRLKQPMCYKKAWYDHYYTKSWEDWVERFTSRGDVCPGNVKLDEFFIYNKINVSDLVDYDNAVLDAVQRREEMDAK